MSYLKRDYVSLLDRIKPTPDRDALMQRTVDALWDAFKPQGVSWIGFYLWSSRQPKELVLGAMRDKPACSPIGLHGVCGRSFTSRRAVVVRDVGVLGANYVACDPRDRAEVVVPLLNPDGSAWAVLDADSHETSAFDVFDAMSLTRLLKHLGLSTLDVTDPDQVELV